MTWNDACKVMQRSGIPIVLWPEIGGCITRLWEAGPWRTKVQTRTSSNGPGGPLTKASLPVFTARKSAPRLWLSNPATRRAQTKQAAVRRCCCCSWQLSWMQPGRPPPWTPSQSGPQSRWRRSWLSASWAPCEGTRLRSCARAASSCRRPPTAA